MTRGLVVSCVLKGGSDLRASVEQEERAMHQGRRADRNELANDGSWSRIWVEALCFREVEDLSSGLLKAKVDN